jgi:hypothetical protein
MIYLSMRVYNLSMPGLYNKVNKENRCMVSGAHAPKADREGGLPLSVFGF